MDSTGAASRARRSKYQGAGDLSQFFASVHKVLETPELQALLAELETLRPAR